MGWGRSMEALIVLELWFGHGEPVSLACSWHGAIWMCVEMGWRVVSHIHIFVEVGQGGISEPTHRYFARGHPIKRICSKYQGILKHTVL